MTGSSPASGPASAPARRSHWAREAAGARAFVVVVSVAPLAVVVVWLLVSRRDQGLGWLLGVLSLALVMVATVYRTRVAAAGERAMAAWARSAGWVLVRDARAPLGAWPGLAPAIDRARRPRAPSIVDQWRLPPFGAPYGAVVTALYRGHHCGLPAGVFEYAVSGGVPLTATQVRYHVVALGLQSAVPTTWLAPRTDDPPAVAKGREVLFESAEFNDKWHVTSDDARFAHAVVSPLLMTRLLEPDALGHHLRFEGSSLVHWRLGYGAADPAGTVQALGLLADVVGAIPPFVWAGAGRPAVPGR